MTASQLLNWLLAQVVPSTKNHYVMISIDGKLIPLLTAKVMTVGGGAQPSEEVFVLYPEPIQEDVEYYASQDI